uniref:Cytochrome P450 n=1 Tax=Ditylenchus dipsaci TaxID=166011 RepID=A0A915D5W9_9BILA
MIVFPEVQTKMQEELDRKIGDNEQGTKRVTLADRAKLPYTNAVISESQRLCNLLPMNLSHKATKDVEIGGFKIAKGTVIVPNISNVLYDDKLQILILEEPLDNRRTAIQPRSTIVLRKPSTT